MKNAQDVFRGCIPALMTPCNKAGEPDFEALVRKGKELIAKGMNAVVYCGSMGDWPLLSDSQRMEGVEKLAKAGVPVIVGTGAQNTKIAVSLAVHGREAGAVGLMIIPRVLSRGTSTVAQKDHFSAILSACGKLPSVIYNSPYYGYETKADLFFELHQQYPHLVGFKEFGGAESLTYAAEHITSGNKNLILMAGVDTQVYHGFVHCGAQGAITGVGNALPVEVLKFISLCERTAAGDAQARIYAQQLEEAMRVLATYDEGPDLVLYYKYLMVLEGSPEYQYHFNPNDQLSASQKGFIEFQWKLFRSWWKNWPGKEY